MHLGIFDLAPGAAANVSAHVDDKDFVGHINLALVHIVEHLLGTFGSDFIIPRMAKESDVDDNIAFKCQAFLRFKELVLETGAAAEGYNFVFADHRLVIREQ